MIQSIVKEVWNWITGGFVFCLVVLPFIGGYMLYQSFNTVYVDEVLVNNERTYTTTVRKGNESTCNWTAVGGNAAIPYKESTTAYGEEQKHYIPMHDYYEWTVVCTDNLGHTYTGEFGKK